VAVDDIFVGMSFPRNPKLAAVFYRLGFIEAYGTGIPRVMGEYRSALVKPTVEMTTNIFSFNLPAMSQQADDQISVDAIMGFAGSVTSFSRSEAERKLGLSRTKLAVLLPSMASEGLLERTGTGKGTRYRAPKS